MSFGMVTASEGKAEQRSFHISVLSFAFEESQVIKHVSVLDKALLVSDQLFVSFWAKLLYHSSSLIDTKAIVDEQSKSQFGRIKVYGQSYSSLSAIFLVSLPEPQSSSPKERQGRTTVHSTSVSMCLLEVHLYSKCRHILYKKRLLQCQDFDAQISSCQDKPHRIVKEVLVANRPLCKTCYGEEKTAIVMAHHSRENSMTRNAKRWEWDEEKIFAMRVKMGEAMEAQLKGLRERCWVHEAANAAASVEGNQQRPARGPSMGERSLD
ncbi:hypothetical protein N7G274_006497 [Stereocaulon virgatum]|uniref:Uncharacterized protein n=1 Tax=Stereocaulon virgatum TaxID=373712 RepID=A0ABR4A627_9LECA